jgi:tripartite-type tricarboxylate transporter receptor subunit TctC
MLIDLRTLGNFLRSLLTMIMAAMTFGLVSLSVAHAEYPERQITLIVCFGAGGGTDIAARLISAPLQQALGKPVVVENRAGAGGNLGIAAVARAAPDGYTLLVCSSAFVVNPSLYVNANYDPIKDFIPVMLLGGSPNVYTVRADSKIRSLSEFIAAVKANPGKTNWTSPGVGTTPYLAGEILKMRAGLDMQHIPYRAVPAAVQAVLAGDAEMMTANYGSLAGQIDSGLLRALAQTGKSRWPEIPNVPTLDELGIKDAETDTSYGLFAPAGTPQPVIDRLVKALSQILQQPDVVERYRKSGAPVIAEGPDAFKARIAREVPMYKQIVEKAGLKVE